MSWIKDHEQDILKTKKRLRREESEPADLNNEMSDEENDDGGDSSGWSSEEE